MQFNICVSDFTAGNASTMFVLNTHKLAEHTPDQVEIKRQLETGDGLFAGAIQFEAPAGAAIIYDSRMYHRGLGNGTKEARVERCGIRARTYSYS